jgi:hypothetical protein
MRRDGRFIEIVHAIPGRVRFRLDWLGADPGAARRIAEELGALEGIAEVRVRPRTGSVLCAYEAPLDARAVAELLRELTGVDVRSRADARAAAGEPPGGEHPREPGGSSVGRATAALVQDLDRKVSRATEGRLDLPTLATLGLVGAGALEAFVTRTLPAPPWFILAWWGLEVFAAESKAIERSAGDGRGDGAGP